jgi:hypothetical protein
MAFNLDKIALLEANLRIQADPSMDTNKSISISSNNELERAHLLKYISESTLKVKTSKNTP